MSHWSQGRISVPRKMLVNFATLHKKTKKFLFSSSSWKRSSPPGILVRLDSALPRFWSAWSPIRLDTSDSSIFGFLQPRPEFFLLRQASSGRKEGRSEYQWRPIPRLTEWIEGFPGNDSGRRRSPFWGVSSRTRRKMMICDSPFSVILLWCFGFCFLLPYGLFSGLFPVFDWNKRRLFHSCH